MFGAGIALGAIGMAAFKGKNPPSQTESESPYPFTKPARPTQNQAEEEEEEEGDITLKDKKTIV